MTTTPTEPFSLGDLDSPPPSKFARTLLRRSELAKLPPVEPLIEGVLSQRAAVLLVGQTGAGKTFLALSWACSVATGTDWLGHRVERRPVLYVVGEGAWGLDSRVAAWEAAWGVDVGDDDLVFSIRPDSLIEMETWVQMAAEARQIRAGLVVLDTFSSLAYDADETKDAATIMRRLSDLAGQVDATSVLVHHPGWGDATRARGGSQLEANADEVILLSGGPKTDLVQMERKKVKEGPAGGQTWLRRKPFGESLVIEAANDAEVRREAAGSVEQVVRDLFDGQLVSRSTVRDALMEKLGVGKTAAYEYASELIRSGVLARSGGTDGRPTYEVR